MNPVIFVLRITGDTIGQLQEKRCVYDCVRSWTHFLNIGKKSVIDSKIVMGFKIYTEKTLFNTEV